MTEINTRLVLPVGTFSFPHLFEASAVEEGGTKRYSCQVLYSLNDDLSGLQNIIKSLVDKHFPDGIPAGSTLPLMKGSAYKPGDEFYADKMIVSMAMPETQGRPALVYNDANRTEIIDRTQLYAGCRVIPHVSVYYFTKGKKGIACGLNGILKTGDGDRLDNRPTVNDMFGGVEATGQAVAPTEAEGGADTGDAAPAANKMPWE